MMEDRGIAQVSMNMVNYEDTPLYVVYEMVRLWLSGTAPISWTARSWA